MQENNKLWLEIKEMFETSQTEVMIFNGAGSDSAKICDMLRVTSASAMGAVMLNTSGVVFDDWIRLYGGDTSDRVGISKINLLSKNGTPERVKQMLIVATDVGGRKLSVLSSTAISACVGCGAIFVAVLAFAYVITKIDATDLMLSVMSTAALGIGAYAGGYVCGKRQRRNGLLSGVLCGVFIFLIIVILSALFSKAAESFSVPAKLVLTLVCAGVGGVVGVNSKSSRF